MLKHLANKFLVFMIYGARSLNGLIEFKRPQSIPPKHIIDP
jgi:hypothetical protein